MMLGFVAAALLIGVAQAHRSEIVPERPSLFVRNPSLPGSKKSGEKSLRGGDASELPTVEELLSSLGGEYVIADQYTTRHNGVTHTYVKQYLHGIPIQNGEAQLNSKDGRVLSLSTSFYRGQPPPPPMEKSLSISPRSATASFLNFVEAKPDECSRDVPPKLFYVVVGSELVLSYRVECDLNSAWLESYVSAVTGEVIVQLDYFHDERSQRRVRDEDEPYIRTFGGEEGINAGDDVSDSPVSSASSGFYSVYTLPNIDPGMAHFIPTIVNQPHLQAFPAEASTLGWHDQGDGGSFSTTIGNNVYAQENHDGGVDFLENYRPEGGSDLSFNFTYDFTKQPNEQPNLDSSITNLFYLNNVMHDVFYGYGFDEVSGNFQETNLGRGGLENDAVQANAQDGSGKNNANFATPPDGERPRMRMYVWDTDTGVLLDGDLAGEIVFHEYSHGISNRLTGGPANAGCLTGVKYGAGMGEGWSDFFGETMTLTMNSKAEDARTTGDWVVKGGIRSFPYSRSMEINPLTFGSLNSQPYGGEVHAAGEVWATVLWDAMWGLIDRYGFDSDMRASGTGGNNVMLQLVVDGMKMQPCRPTMLDARDAILLADEVNNAGEHYCLLWASFARRGFGTDAKAPTGIFGNAYHEDFSVPSDCSVTPNAA